LQKAHAVTPELLKSLSIASGTMTIYHGEGFAACKNSECQGKAGLFELIDDRRLLKRPRDGNKIRTTQTGFKTVG